MPPKYSIVIQLGYYHYQWAIQLISSIAKHSFFFFERAGEQPILSLYYNPTPDPQPLPDTHTHTHKVFSGYIHTFEIKQSALPE